MQLQVFSSSNMILDVYIRLDTRSVRDTVFSLKHCLIWIHIADGNLKILQNV